MQFSIIVPIYNKESYLRNCFASLSAQTGDFEILLVDDGSTDGSPVLCDEFVSEHPNSRVIHKPNGGLISARETGFRNAVGDYLLFVDADDSLEPDALSHLSALISDTSADMYLFGAYEVHSDTKKRFVIPDLPSGLFSDRCLLYDHLFLTYSVTAIWIKCCRRELYNGLDFSRFHRCNYGEDMLISAFLFQRAAAFFYSDTPLYNYTIESGMMRHYSSAYFDSYKTVNKECVRILQNEQITDLEQKAGVHLLRSAYGAAIQFRYENKIRKEELVRLSGDPAFRHAYETVRATPYTAFLSKKEKTVSGLLYHKHFHTLSVLIRLRRLLDLRQK